MTKLFRIPKEKPKAKRKPVTLAMCRRLTERIDPEGFVEVDLIRGRYWVRAVTPEHGIVASALHPYRPVAVAGLYAALTIVVPEGK